MSRIKGYLIVILMSCTEVLKAQGFSVSQIPDAVFQRMQGHSWPKDCQIKRSDFHYLTVKYYDEKGIEKRGELICNKSVSEDLLTIFQELYAAHYPIHSIRLIDDYDGNDEKSMEANNTSCFNYRNISGRKRLSKHSTGIAIDINPLWNPCIHSNGKIEPSNGAKYKDRSDRKIRDERIITTQDTCYKIFRKHGWHWGGSWKRTKDYQHFEK